MLLLTASCAGDDAGALADRQALVAERGAQVMPFDLETTTHTFTTTGHGGIQTVVADDSGDDEQVALIRSHLREERDNFSRGDFDDPAAIHGHDMDGVDELAAGYTDITVEYRDTADGAELTYTTDDPDLVDALHAWFGRQVTDHGTEAIVG
jgi:hypothetical protein